MYILYLNYYESSESEHPDEHFELNYYKGDELKFAELYNLRKVEYGGEIDYKRETNVEEVKKWLKDGVISLSFAPDNDSKRFNEIVYEYPSPKLEIVAFYWQSGYD